MQAYEREEESAEEKVGAGGWVWSMRNCRTAG